jgi:hypothetical protein
MPSLCRYDGELDIDAQIGPGQAGELAQSQPVAHGNGKQTDARGKGGVQHVALNHAADRIRSVEQHDAKVRFPRRTHDGHRGGEIGVVASARILQIHQHEIYPPQHFVVGGRTGAIKAVDWKPSGRIFR